MRSLYRSRNLDWTADSINSLTRLAAEADRFQEECALLREELRIKDTSKSSREFLDTLLQQGLAETVARLRLEEMIDLMWIFSELTCHEKRRQP